MRKKEFQQRLFANPVQTHLAGDSTSEYFKVFVNVKGWYNDQCCERATFSFRDGLKRLPIKIFFE